MKSTNEAIQYTQSGLFVLAGWICVKASLRERNKQWMHLALATGLLGLANTLSIAMLKIYGTQRRPPPRALNASLGIVLLLSAVALVLFLHDFIHFPTWVMAVAIVITLGNVVLSIIETPEYLLVGSDLVQFHGVSNPIPYTVAVVEGFVWLALVFGAVWISFVVYGRRLKGLARLRMLSFGAGFFLLFIAVIIVPAVASKFARGGAPSPDAVENMNLALQILALASAPLVLLGVAPPLRIRRSYETRRSPTLE